MDLIVTTPERISQIVTEAVSIAIKNHVPKVEPLPDRIKIDEVSRLTGRSKSAIYKLTMENKLPFSKFGNELVFSRKEITRWIDEQTIPSTSKEHQVSRSLMEQAKRRVSK